MARDFGIVMYKCDFKYWSNILNQVNEDDLYIDENDDIYGYEVTPHVTVLYGLHANVSNRKVVDVVSKFKNVEIEYNGVSSFDVEKYDVLKIDVSPNQLLEYHELLKKTFDYTSDFDEYHPHITIAYLKKGAAKKYHNKNAVGVVKCTSIEYNSADGYKKTIKI